MWVVRNIMQINHVYFPDDVITSPVSQISEAFPLLLNPKENFCTTKVKPKIYDRLVQANNLFTNAIGQYSKVLAIFAMDFIMEEMLAIEHARSEFMQAIWIYKELISSSDKVTIEKVQNATKDVFSYTLNFLKALKSTEHKLAYPQGYLALIGESQIKTVEWLQLINTLCRTAREYGLSKANKMEFFRFFDNKKYIYTDIHSVNLDTMIGFALLKEDLQSYDFNQYSKVPYKTSQGYLNQAPQESFKKLSISPFLFFPKEENEDQELFILLAVVSSPKEFQRRQMIRNTWGRTRIINGKRIRAIFFMGIDQSGIVQVRIEKEAQMFQDIVQYGFPDIYTFLVGKTACIFDWASRNCTTAKWVVKIDSDVLLRPEKMIALLEQNEFKRTALGIKIEGMPPLRDVGHKNFEPFELFSGEKYAPYLSGSCYAISGDLVYELAETMIHMPWLRNEDAFTGSCLNRMGITLTNTYPQQDSWVLEFTPRCDLLNKYVSAHTIRFEKVKSLWSEFAGGFVEKKCKP